MATQLPDVQHLRVQRISDDNSATDIYTFTTDFGGTAEMIVTRKLVKSQRDAAVNAISNVATDLAAFAKQKGSQPAAVSLDAHARALADQVVPDSVRDLLNRPDQPLLISTTDPGFPWQLVLVGDTPLGLLRPLAIRATLPQRRESAPPAATPRAPRSALLIADPNGDHAQAHLEIDAIAGSLRALDPHIHIVSLLHAEATLQQVQLHLSQPYDLIHYAGHLDWEKTHGQRGIVLWGDALLPIAAIHHTRHPGAAIFLNGCWGSAFTITHSPDSFQMSVPMHPEGRPEGFGVEFARSGARSYLAPLWPVYDALAADFSQRVYAYLAAGLSFGDALLKVRRDLRRERPWDPTWAVYVLYGHPSEPLFTSTATATVPGTSAAARLTPPAGAAPVASPSGPPRAPLSPSSVGAPRGSDLHPIFLQAADQVEQHWFANDTGHLDEDAHTALALALQTLYDQCREDLHTLDLLVAALHFFARTVPEAPELLADLADGPTARDLVFGARHASAAASGGQVNPAALAHAAFRAVDVLIYSDERHDDPSGKLGLARLAGEAVRRAAELADEAGRDAVTCADLIEALLAEPEGNFGRALELLRCDPTPTIARLRQHRLPPVAAAPFVLPGASGGNIPTPIVFDYRAGLSLPNGATQADPSQRPPTAPAAVAAPAPPSAPARTLGRDLLDLARGGALRYVAGWADRSSPGMQRPAPGAAPDPDPRRPLFDRLASTLTRDLSPHALIVGPDGAGRWALVEALAYALAAPTPDAAIAALAGLPLLALHAKSAQTPGVSAAERLTSVLGQLGSGTPAILVVRDLSGFLTAPAARVQIVEALDRALDTRGLHLVVTAGNVSHLTAILGSNRVGRFEQITVPSAPPADAVRMIAGHIRWLQMLKQIPIPGDAQAAAAEESGPLAQPGLGLRILALACDARRSPVTASQAGGTIISISRVDTLPATTVQDFFAALTVDEVRAAARSLRIGR